MAFFQVIADSSADLSDQELQEYGIDLVPYQISFDSHTYRKEREELPVRAFYEEVAANPGVYPKTSMPNVADFADVMLKAAEKGQDILCLCMSGKFSSSWKSAQTAADLIAEQHPDIRIHVMDTTMTTGLEGLFVKEAARLRDHDKTLEEAISRLQEIQPGGSIFFTVGSMDYLIHGGRVGKLKGKIVESVKLKPLILMKDGELFPIGVGRTRKISARKVLDEFCKYIEEKKLDLKDYEVVTGYGLDEEEGKAFHQQVLERLIEQFGFQGKLGLCQIGATLCVHTGPYPLGIGILEKAV